MRDPLTPVYAAACADYSPERCRAAVAELADHFPALRDTQPGARVLVKANLVTALRPEKAATTHPALLAALTEYLTARGASVSCFPSRFPCRQVYPGGGISSRTRPASRRPGEGICGYTDMISAARAPRKNLLIPRKSVFPHLSAALTYAFFQI